MRYYKEYGTLERWIKEKTNGIVDVSEQFIKYLYTLIDEMNYDFITNKEKIILIDLERIGHFDDFIEEYSSIDVFLEKFIEVQEDINCHFDDNINEKIKRLNYIEWVNEGCMILYKLLKIKLSITK